MNESNMQAGVAVVALLGFLLIGVVVLGLLINAFVCWFVSGCLQQIPADHRRMEPGQVWLLLIPCFGLIWNFQVFRRVPESFESYFASVGRTGFGDCGRNIGMWYSICGACSMIPILNYAAAPAALVLLIMNLVKLNQLKQEIR